MVEDGGQVPANAASEAAGPRSSQRLPNEVIEMHAADQPPEGVPLNPQPAQRVPDEGGVNPLWILVAGLALAAITAFFVLVRM